MPNWFDNLLSKLVQPSTPMNPKKLLRDDQKTYKDIGYYGPLPVPGGPQGPGMATEYAMPMWEEGVYGTPSYRKGPDMPTLVPGLTQAELDTMLNDVIPNRKPIPQPIIEKARAHAKKRINAGLSPFFNSELEGEPPLRPPMAGEKP